MRRRPCSAIKPTMARSRVPASVSPGIAATRRVSDSRSRTFILSSGAVKSLPGPHALRRVGLNQTVAHRRIVKAPDNRQFKGARRNRQAALLQIFAIHFDFVARNVSRVQTVSLAPFDPHSDFAPVSVDGIGRSVAVGDVDAQKPLEGVHRIDVERRTRGHRGRGRRSFDNDAAPRDFARRVGASIAADNFG